MENAMLLMQQRHSVRRYTEKTISQETREALDAYAAELNAAGDLNMQIVYDEPKCFSGRMAHYGHFENCRNYIALVGKRSPDLSEKCGYYGELLVLKAQALGLNTCWVALTRGKTRAQVGPGESMVIVIALGYGKKPGRPHTGKPAEEVSNLADGDPAWFRNGVEAALLAPTAVNQQKFTFTRQGNTVTAKAGKLGACLKIDLGIAKCHFELGAGKENFTWN